MLLDDEVIELDAGKYYKIHYRYGDQKSICVLIIKAFDGRRIRVLKDTDENNPLSGSDICLDHWSIETNKGESIEEIEESDAILELI